MSNEIIEDEPTIEAISRLKRLAKTPDELCARYLSIVAARIWETCSWPDRMADGWKIGDYKFIVLSVSPDANTELYVQFWSEPRERVLVEVCSGGRAVRHRQRRNDAPGEGARVPSRSGDGVR
jgi:hypothetical protein